MCIRDRTLPRYKFYGDIAAQAFTKTSPTADEIQKLNLVQVPESKRPGTIQFTYGKLAGKFIPREVYENIFQINKIAEGPKTPFFRGYRALNQIWKASKTAWNPTVHVNNVMSNFILHDLVGADFKFLPKAWTALRTHGKKNKAGKIQQSKLVLDAQKNGVFDADFVSVELEKFQTTLINPYKYNESVDVLNNSVNTASQIYKEIRAKNILSNATEWYRLSLIHI